MTQTRCAISACVRAAVRARARAAVRAPMRAAVRAPMRAAVRAFVRARPAGRRRRRLRRRRGGTSAGAPAESPTRSAGPAKDTAEAQRASAHKRSSRPVVHRESPRAASCVRENGRVRAPQTVNLVRVRACIVSVCACACANVRSVHVRVHARGRAPVTDRMASGSSGSSAGLVAAR
eukprot:4899045-Pleurochrysis_carterae.AAC.1